MNFNEYQEKALETRLYPDDEAIVYPALGLNGEAGEVADIVKKAIRAGYKWFDPERLYSVAVLDQRDKLIDELGDILWYIAAMAYDLGCPLEYIAQDNIRKLADRANKGKISEHD